MRSPDIRHSLQLLCLVGTPCHQRRDLSEEHTGSVQGLCSYFSIHQSPPGLLGLGRRETGNTPSAEDRATLGSDPSADWSPANGRSGGLHTKAARLAHCRGREKSEKSIPSFKPPSGWHSQLASNSERLKYPQLEM